MTTGMKNWTQQDIDRYRQSLKRTAPLRRTGIQKFRAKPVHDMQTGESFDSKGEHARWLDLKMLEAAGAIQNLERQPRVILVPRRGDAREIAWKADAAYTEDGRRVWEDFKRPERAGTARLWTGRDYLLLRLWQHFGPGLLRIVGRGGKLIKTVMPEANNGVTGVTTAGRNVP